MKVAVNANALVILKQPKLRTTTVLPHSLPLFHYFCSYKNTVVKPREESAGAVYSWVGVQEGQPQVRCTTTVVLQDLVTVCEGYARVGSPGAQALVGSGQIYRIRQTP